MQSVHACAVQTNILHLVLTPFFERQKQQKIETVLVLRRGTCDTSQIRGELGGIWEASGGTQETPRRQEAPKRLPEAPRRHPGGTQEAPGAPRSVQEVLGAKK